MFQWNGILLACGAPWNRKNQPRLFLELELSKGRRQIQLCIQRVSWDTDLGRRAELLSLGPPMTLFLAHSPPQRHGEDDHPI